MYVIVKTQEGVFIKNKHSSAEHKNVSILDKT